MLQKFAEDYKNKLQEHSWRGLDEFVRESLSSTNVDIFTQVVGIGPEKRANFRDRDWHVTAKVIDPTIPLVQGKQTSFTCQFFKKTQKELPKVKCGDIILLRKTEVKGFQGFPQLISRKESSFLVYNEEEEGHRSENFIAKPEDQELYEAFKAWLKAKEKFAPSTVVSTGRFGNRRSLLLTKDILNSPDKFFDYVGMIIGYFPKVNNTRIIKLTDFTENPYPYDRSNPAIVDSGVIGNVDPKMMLECTLWDNHATNCPELKHGDYVLLNNCVRNKNSGERGYLQISIRGNTFKWPHVVKLENDDKLLKQLLVRKAQYEKPSSHQKTSNFELKADPIRSRVKDVKARISIQDLIAKEDAGIEYIRATVVKYKPLDIKSWLRDYCPACQKTFEPTIQEQCTECASMLKPVYKAGFVVQDQTKSQLVVWVFGEAADQLFKEYPAHRLKQDPSLWDRFNDYMTLAQQDPNPYFDFGIKKYYSCYSGDFSNHWCYSIVDTEFVLEND